MHTRAATALLAAAGATAALPAHAASPVRCTSGVTLVLDGRLRILGIPFRERDGAVGVNAYACLGRSGRPRLVGGASQSPGTASSETPVVAFDGTRHLAAFSADDGEGGPSASYEVFDLRSRARTTFANGLGGEAPHPFRVTAAGRLVRDDYGIQLIRFGFRGDARLVQPIGSGDEIAYVGSTVYWTECPGGAPAIARSGATVAPGDTPENHVHDLAGVNPANPRGPRRGCAERRGRTIAASPHVRVFVARDAAGRRVRRACRLGRAWLRSPMPGQLRIVSDRWLLAAGATGATVIDTRDGAVAVHVDGAHAAMTLTAHGTLAWLEPGGRLLAQRPRATAPVVLAEATAAPAALAASDRTVYWTSAGGPERWPTR
jgi:hypothetical protein